MTDMEKRVEERASDQYRTPIEIYDLLDNEFHFDFDPCPYPRSVWDGLNINWGKINFVNPPYSETEKWVKKAIVEQAKGNVVVMLLRLDASTVWFRDLVLPNAEVRVFDDRLHFLSPSGKSGRSNFASILAIFGSNKRLNMPVIYWRNNNSKPKSKN